jgi:type VI secretion system protein VasG
VILLDEVEKAHRDVLNLFYQVFDRGVMRDGEGRIIDFRNTVILMTSNLASERIMTAFDTAADAASEIAQEAGEETANARATDAGHGHVSDAMLLETVRPALLEHFQPALLARFQTVVYRPLSEAALRSIVCMKLDKVAQRIAQRFAVTPHLRRHARRSTRACVLGARLGRTHYRQSARSADFARAVARTAAAFGERQVAGEAKHFVQR